MQFFHDRPAGEMSTADRSLRTPGLGSTASNSRMMTDERWIRKYLEEQNHGVIEVIYRHLPGGTHK
jgi:hypothetical protein